MAQAGTTHQREARSGFVERWIGLSRPAAHAAISAADFAPNDFSAYCARCGESVGAGEATATGCAACRGTSAIADRVIRLGPYADPLREWIADFKYEGWLEIGEALAGLLAQRVREAGAIESRTAIVVPVPMPWQRRLYRRIDHARALAEVVGRRLALDVFPVLAKRNGPPQAMRTRSERQHTRRDWIFPRRRIGGWPLHGLEVLLIDDVRTTGSTLRTCGRILRQLGASRVVAGVLAVTDGPGRRGKSAMRDDGDDSDQPPAPPGV